MEWDDLDKLEEKTYADKRYSKIGAIPASEVKRSERELMRAELGDMEDD